MLHSIKNDECFLDHFFSGLFRYQEMKKNQFPIECSNSVLFNNILKTSKLWKVLKTAKLCLVCLV